MKKSLHSPTPRLKASTSQTRQKKRSPFASCQKVSCKRTSGRGCQGVIHVFGGGIYHGVLLCPSSACWYSWNMVGNKCFRVKRSTIMLIYFGFAANGSEQLQERSYHMMPTDKQNITWSTGNGFIQLFGHGLQIQSQKPCAQRNVILGLIFYFHDLISRFSSQINMSWLKMHI